MVDDEWLSAPELAELLGVSLSTVRRQVRQTGFPTPRRIGNRVFWSKQAVEVFYRSPVRVRPDSDDDDWYMTDVTAYV